MRRNRRFMHARDVIIGVVFACFLSTIASAPVQAQREASRSDRAAANLARQQKSVERSISNVRGRMADLAKKMAAPGNTQRDSERLKTAEGMLTRDRVEETLSEAADLLKRGEFLKAVLRQDLALERLDAIIRYLEERQFAERDVNRQLEAVKDARKLAAQLARKQQSLLDKTREVLSDRADLEELQTLQRKLQELAGEQQGLVDGKKPEDIDSSLGGEDAKRLAAARELAHQLAEAQERWNEEAAKLKPDKIPLADTEQLLAKIDQALRLADDLKDRARRARASRSERSSKGSESKGSESKGSESKGSESKGSESKGSESKGEQDARSVEALKKSAQEFKEALEELNKTAEKVDDVSETARDELDKAEKLSGEISAAVNKGELGETERRASDAREALREARRALARQLRRMREQNATETAGLLQKESLLAKETQRGAESTKSQASQSSSQGSEKSLSQAARQMEQAASAMRKARDEMADGDRQAAQQAGQDAAERLREAEKALAEGEQREANRSDADKARDLQRKVARKTDAARDDVDKMLAKKLRKKQPEERLTDVRSALSKASRAMKEATEAGDKGQRSLAKKKQREALEHLQEAGESVEKDKRDQLARLERKKLKKEAREQEELSKLTRDAAKQLAKSSKGPQRSAQERSQQLEQASRNMEQAAESLDAEDPSDAESEQEQALEKLGDVNRDLQEEEERLARLKRETQMTNLIDELAGLKKGEEKILRETILVDSKREPRESRRQKLRLKKKLDKLAREQDQLAEKTQALHKQLKEESAHVFSFVLENVGADMDQAREHLDDLQTGEYTQFLEREIIRDLDQLHVAMKGELERSRQQQQKQQPGQQQRSPSGERLVSMMAELLMLKDLQRQVNSKTTELEDLRQASEGGKPTKPWERAIERLSQKQGSVGHMLQAVIREFEAAARPSNDGQAGEGGQETPEGVDLKRDGEAEE